VTTTGESKPPSLEAFLKKRRRRELIVNLAWTLVGLIGFGTLEYQTSIAIAKARVSDQTQRELKDIAVAAQKFHKEYNRWPRDMFELRNDPKMPFVCRRDHWGRGYVYTPPKEGKVGRIETYGEDGLASGDKRDGDAAYEFDSETATPAAPLPTSTITYINFRSSSTN
jgi:hypothetical protein